MSVSVEELLGIKPKAASAETVDQKIAFSFLFFSDVRKDISDAQKYDFMRDITLFADREGFTSIYLPERHFYEFGSIYANSAVMAAYLIPQTQQIRFRTAGVSLPLHHPAEVVEWWAMNDILSGGRVDLGFGSGWNKADFIYAPDNYDGRREICSERIEMVKQLWRGEEISFPGPDGESYPVKVFPRPIQKELNVWLLVAKNTEAFIHAGRQGYNIFTMLYGNNLEAMKEPIRLYRQAREEVSLDPKQGIITLMLHTLVHEDVDLVQREAEAPFKAYIASALDAHVKAAIVPGEVVTDDEKQKILAYAYQRYFKTSGIFGSLAHGREIIEEAISVGVDDIACLVDFGVDYQIVQQSLPYLKELIAPYIKKNRSTGC
uniref:CalD n=1 Tax=uncultured Candidatus Entotheonella sp. TaxID=312019 RepID=A0A068PC45_9BACT|nr:CalD [uncultured Candidatus Entotheonella sp.]